MKRLTEKPTLAATCGDCHTDWTVYRQSPMRKCPICGGSVRVVGKGARRQPARRRGPNPVGRRRSYRDARGRYALPPARRGTVIGTWNGAGFSPCGLG